MQVKIGKRISNSYLPVRGGSFRAPNETNNCSAATRASEDGGVGKGKLTTCTIQRNKVVLIRRRSISRSAGEFESLSFYRPCLCWGPSFVKPGPPQACEWSLPLRTKWSLQTLRTSTTCRNTTERWRQTFVNPQEKTTMWSTGDSVKVLTCSSVPAQFVPLYPPSDWLRPVRSTWPWSTTLRSLGRRSASWLVRSRPRTWCRGWWGRSRPRWWLPHTDESQVEEAWTPAGESQDFTADV